MITVRLFRSTLLFAWLVVVLIGSLSPGAGRNYELLGTHWLSWTIGAVLLTAAYFLTRDTRRSIAFVAAVVALVLVTTDMVVTLAAVLGLPAATRQQSQPILSALTAASCGVTIALAIAVFSVAVASWTWLYRRIRVKRDTD